MSKASPSNIVDSTAYLLFYRRRSSEPLGGPLFREIVERFVEQSEDEELPDSGEGQRLGEGGSSQSGSSSALQGAEATHQHENPGGEENMGFVLHRSNDDNATLPAGGFNPVSGSNSWSFNTLDLGNDGHGAPGSPAGSDAATDVAQHDSSGDERSTQTMDFDSDSNIPGTSHYELSAQPEPPAYSSSLPPDYRDERLWDPKESVHEIPVGADQSQELDETTTDIHLDDTDSGIRL